ncbi:MAG: methyltransferase family protein [Nitrospinota bacterium]
MREFFYRHRSYLPVPFLCAAFLLVLFTGSPFSEGGFIDELFDYGAIALCALGEGIRVWAVGFAGRSTRSKRLKAKLLVTAGPFQYIRNPIYLGNFMIALGMALISESLLIIFGVLMYFGFVYWNIILLEERFLSAAFGEAYHRYRAEVPRFLPRRGRRSSQPQGSFEVRALRKEYWTALSIALFLSLPELAEYFHLRFNIPGVLGFGGDLALWSYNQWRVVGTFLLTLSGVGIFSRDLSLPGIGVMMLGMMIRCWSLGYLRKKKELVTSGPYAYIRHPLYVGNIIMAAGVGLGLSNVPLALAFAGGAWLIFHIRIRKEERHLKLLYPREYDEYCGRVPRWIPNTISASFLKWPFRGWNWRLFRVNQGITQIAGFVLFILWWDVCEDILNPWFFDGVPMADLLSRYFRHIL